MTGRLPHETGVLVNGMAPTPSLPNMGELFRRAGYRTTWTGRWHLPANDRQICGFDVLHNSEVRLSLGLEGDGPVTDAAIEFLQRQHDQPFFFSVSLCNPTTSATGSGSSRCRRICRTLKQYG